LNLLRQGGGAPGAEPDPAAVEQLAQKELKDIAAQVEPHINTAETDGVVRTHMINDSIQRAVLASAGAAPTGMAGLFQSDWARPVGLGAMGLMALGLMFGMVRKATTQSADLPSVEELAGVPPTLPSDDDLVGEAEESENTMEGVELDREELRYRQLNEQIAELVKSRPDDAASLLGKWVRVDD
jgi:flagellar biosynthesis/type III secretory pathway M-ring protein FliF/YscJ